ncbi:DUF5518 domain-containing protein [Natronorubrum halophilum]|uniref:DUF5518 domain-containing protein n=1 Tax=Natronorubrum halophilum TaxID=1702106 RepID=UPI0010C1A962|nr:DUF5518 domain-containing protein [Natronorubrum halophilum]
MVSDTADTPPPIDTYGTESNDDSNTVFNALLGGLAGIVLSFLPGSTLLGGAIAGYLEGGDPADGLRVGALAGVVMLVPFVVFGFLASMFFLGVGSSVSMFGVVLLAVLVVAVYAVGLSILGAVFGIYVRNER